MTQAAPTYILIRKGKAYCIVMQTGDSGGEERVWLEGVGRRSRYGAGGAVESTLLMSEGTSTYF